jgi:hypothetical protein
MCARPSPHPPVASHLDEIAEIIAQGVLQLLAQRRRQNTNDTNGLGDFPLDFPAKESVCRHKLAQGREV